MQKNITPLIGKAIRLAARLRGGGSALPGLVVEKLDPSFMKRTLAQLPHGVVVVSGTNGKTTTTKMVVELLASQGLKVFTNKTGSNFTRGVAAALVGQVNLRGNLNADIAVLELDEAHAVHFVQQVQPRYSLLLNVMRDQLDRFGEIDTTAALLEKIAHATTDVIVTNREDNRLSKLTAQKDARIAYFGLATSLKTLFPNDDDLHAQQHDAKQNRLPASVVLQAIKKDNQATFLIGDKEVSLPLKLDGVYNIYNAAAALALVCTIMANSINEKKLFAALSAVTPAFGRGETFTIGGRPLELVLVKNPAGFRLGLTSFAPENYATMIAINDNYADGRDMSWLWDVDFSSLQKPGVASVSGVRAYDMALRLQYNGVSFGSVDPQLKKAFTDFMHAHAEAPKRIYCTYTAMLQLRRLIKPLADVKEIDA